MPGLQVRGAVLEELVSAATVEEIKVIEAQTTRSATGIATL
jgi:hypothetical protein